MKAKLYASKSGFTARVNALTAHFELKEGQRWCPEMKVEDGGEDDGKWIVPLPVEGTYKADHLVSGIVEYNYGWHDEPPSE